MYETANTGDSQPLLPFMVAHGSPIKVNVDPATKEEERKRVTTKFRALFGGLMRNHSTDVDHLGPPYDNEALTLHLQPVKEGSYWTSGLRAKTTEHEFGDSDFWRPSEQHEALLQIQRVENSRGRESFRYALGTDGIIRRADTPDPRAYAVPQNEHAIVAPVDEPREDSNERGVDDLANARAEEDLGMNNLPVGEPEMDGLSDFMMQEGWIVR